MAASKPPATTFYKRELPPTCIDYASAQGKHLFKVALSEGNMESYFRLASQFTTQSEPAFCGLGTLCMVLNSLGVDPQRQWKGPWRWYDDSMLDCCRPLEEIKHTGITLGEFGCLALCNGLAAKVYRADRVSKAKFLQDVVRTSAREDEVLCVSYNRGTLQQTGNGHFSPVAGYCAAQNMVLILDVARFKYPPYWVSVDLLWESLLPHDPDTNKPRGYVILKRRELEVASTLPKLSLTTATIAVLMHTLFEEFPRKLSTDPDLEKLSVDEIITRLLACIPEELSEVLQERTIDDIATAVVQPQPPSGPGSSTAIPTTDGVSAVAVVNGITAALVASPVSAEPEAGPSEPATAVAAESRPATAETLGSYYTSPRTMSRESLTSGTDGGLGLGETPVASRRRDRHASIVSFRNQYQRQLDQLIHRVHETPLCARVVHAMRLGAVRHRSVSLAAVPLPTRTPSAADGLGDPASCGSSAAAVGKSSGGGTTHHPAKCRFCRPDDGSCDDLFSSPSGTIGPAAAEAAPSSATNAATRSGTSGRPLGGVRPADPKTPAFLTMLLLALPLNLVLPPESELEERNAKLASDLHALWSLERAPLLVKTEVQALANQVNALRRAWCEEHADPAKSPCIPCNALGNASSVASFMSGNGVQPPASPAQCPVSPIIGAIPSQVAEADEQVAAAAAGSEGGKPSAPSLLTLVQADFAQAMDLSGGCAGCRPSAPSAADAAAAAVPPSASTETARGSPSSCPRPHLAQHGHDRVNGDSAVPGARSFTVSARREKQVEGVARHNPLNIQMLSPSLHAQLFPGQTRAVDDRAVAISQAHLQHWELDIAKSTSLPDLDLRLPPLQGRTIAEHFAALGRDQAAPYLAIVDAYLARGPGSDPPRPTEWVEQAGWTRYARDGTATRVPYPEEPLLVFDIEVLVQVSNFPVMATAMGADAWYAWVSPWLYATAGDGGPDDVPRDLIPLGPHRKVVIGHSVGYDRAAVLEEYCLAGSETAFLDTLSLHVATNGMSSQQRPAFDKVDRIKRAAAKAKAAEALGVDVPAPAAAAAAAAAAPASGKKWKGKSSSSATKWMKHTTGNSLAAVSEFYLGRTLDKDVRNVFVEATDRHTLLTEFDALMNYCADDVAATSDVFRVVFPKFRAKCPHPVSFVGMLRMGSCFLPVNQSWPAFVKTCDARVDEMVAAIDQYLVDLAHKTVEDCIDTSAARTWNGQPPDPDFPLSSYLPETLHRRDGAIDASPWLSQLDWECPPLKLTKKGAPYKAAKLPNYPNWFRELWDPKLKRITITQRKHVTPLLLHLEWDGHPLVYSAAHKWGYMVHPDKAETHNPVGPEMSFAGDSDNAALFRPWLTRGYTFFKLPHKDGDDANAGSPFSKSLAAYFDDGTLRSEHPIAKNALELQMKASYWIAAGERIRTQHVVWDDTPADARGVKLGILSPAATPEEGEGGNGGERWGMILPKMHVMGTITRRAVEPTWLTASNAKKNRIGSDIKRYVAAPPGYAMVGADVDSEELWISSVLGDAQFGLHGSTALGWMTLQGTKADGTDLHSVTATILGISRDQAKQFNYARIYGAGITFATNLLAQHNRHLSAAEADAKARTLHEKTKGIKSDAVLKGVTPADFEFWMGGRESYMFNSIEAIAHSDDPRTPVLGCQIPDALMREHCGAQFLTSRINWVVQSSGVDYLHLLIVGMDHLCARHGIQARLMLTIHDEIRYLVRDEDKYRAAMALQISNLWTRAMFVHQMGLDDLPLSVAFFSAVDIDHCLRKEVTDPCITPTNPTPVPPGEAVDVYKLLAKGAAADLRVTDPVPPPPAAGQPLPSLNSLQPDRPVSWLLLQSQASVEDYLAKRDTMVPEAELVDAGEVTHRPSKYASRSRTARATQAAGSEAAYYELSSVPPAKGDAWKKKGGTAPARARVVETEGFSVL
ncbi:DNA-directed DNA polymerase gamma mip1 [Blastocladiella emersonii ATCC 22665]|nr:DNA-directed DNA polymerase gamma mip1 [Blastocladiella emersonii ATCC 22665]